ncbi:hypothetical protein KFL_001460230 [Klebsormidium nitens]|uniref:DUF1279 domain-containing protein n=1 Tax=Klebsormidium nitens TaxID=105231 RepID=A0A1Y1I5K3_KLENI|nr:hypothetical protein KFL_001460230 [Klebsormidium nitens]|eukprot:GAQ83398.1 hypothetical protein KFL_001460230 [Klebsormidium nitens]
MASGSSGGLGSRLAQLTKKYGKVALGVHISVSILSTASLYFAISHNVDVNKLLERVGLASEEAVEHQAADLQVEMDKFGIPGGPRVNHTEQSGASGSDQSGGGALPGADSKDETKKGALGGFSGKTVQGGSALALAVLANKALFPIRVPITLALTPYVSRLLSKRGAHAAAQASASSISARTIALGSIRPFGSRERIIRA